jgi:hypothetical protein
VTIWAISDVALAVKEVINGTLDNNSSDGTLSTTDGTTSSIGRNDTSPPSPNVPSASITRSESTVSASAAGEAVASASKWKDLVLVFPRIDEAVRFVQSVSSLASRSNGQWFLDTILCPGGHSADGNRSSSVDNESRLLNRPTTMTEYEDCRDSEDLRSTQFTHESHASLSVLSRRSRGNTANSVVRKGSFFKLKMRSGSSRVWRIRKYEIHRGESGAAGTFLYQSENATHSSSTSSVVPAASGNMKVKALQGCFVNVSIVEMKVPLNRT